VGDVTEELLAAVAKARASRAEADADHEHVIELLIRHRREKPDYGPGDLEELIDKYLDRGTISRRTAGAFDGQPPRKPTRRRSGSAAESVLERMARETRERIAGGYQGPGTTEPPGGTAPPGGN
jgi:hypothetical protein